MKNIKKIDGSFNITINNMPYNTIQGDKHYNETLKLFQERPELFEKEVIKERELTYVEKRIMEYPSITDQLDMIYHDKVSNTNLWIEKITEIKSKYPKN